MLLCRKAHLGEVLSLNGAIIPEHEPDQAEPDFRTWCEEVTVKKIRGIEGLPNDQLDLEIDRGARFVMYWYCWSTIVMTFKEASDIHFIRAGEGRVARGFPYILLTLALGWWGFPFGPIYSIQSLMIDFQGGEDVAVEVLSRLQRPSSVILRGAMLGDP